MLTTVAPENVTTAQVSSLVESGVIVSVGHSDVTAEVVREYFDAGATMVTRLFNAMSPLGNRERVSSARPSTTAGCLPA
ncbi:hypothetical protein [Rhizobium tumorigenes]|uniref:hypothetical protein n=1 Tax=Rhizobium tumorigenes TaxID=2041385 RepID=UPI00241CE866|nr:hypothetical protein [Rhizobium tumorigenes]WFR99576.1 hypothetical protein PR016_10385 [Rhizobium tumorigenes]